MNREAGPRPSDDPGEGQKPDRVRFVFRPESENPGCTSSAR